MKILPTLLLGIVLATVIHSAPFRVARKHGQKPPLISQYPIKMELELLAHALETSAGHATDNTGDKDPSISLFPIKMKI